jgi:hypothetical protein
MKDCDVQVEVPSSIPEDKPEASLSQVVEVSDMTWPQFRSLLGGGGGVKLYLPSIKTLRQTARQICRVHNWEDYSRHK